MVSYNLKTPLGNAFIQGNEDGVFRISIGDEIKENPPEVPVRLQTAILQLNEYFYGKRTAFDFPMNPSGTFFQKKVWQELQQVPFGKTLSYLELSKRLGNPKAIRAVAAANAKNPLWVVVPCHRIIGIDGSLTGYAGGLWRKKWLLEHEQSYTQQVLF